MVAVMVALLGAVKTFAVDAVEAKLPAEAVQTAFIGKLGLKYKLSNSPTPIFVLL